MIHRYFKKKIYNIKNSCEYYLKYFILKNELKILKLKAFSFKNWFEDVKLISNIIETIYILKLKDTLAVRSYYNLPIYFLLAGYPEKFQALVVHGKSFGIIFHYDMIDCLNNER